jgi:hypothetical protein
MTDTVDQRACQRCGAQNRLDTDFCWQCYTPFRGGPSTFGSDERTTPLARAVSGRTATMAPAEPRVKMGSGGTSPLVGTVIRFLILAGLVAGGWFAWQHFNGGFPFPDEVEGEPRIEGETGSNIEDLLHSAAELFDMEVEVAVYGDLQSPTYVMYTYTIPGGESVDDWLGRLDTLPGSEKAFLTEATEAGFACQADPSGADCAWMAGDDLIVGLGGLGLTEEQVRPIAEEVRSETE